MLLDSKLIFLDGDLKAGDSNEVALTSFLHPGRMEPIPFCLKCTAAPTSASGSITVKLQEADAKGGAYSDVTDGTITIPATDLKAGYKCAVRFLPTGVKKPWLKLNVAGTTGTGGKVFAAIVREDDLPYVKGMYIKGGVVKG